MKKLMGILALCVFTAGAVYAQTVTVTKPSAGETWVKGTTYTITWTKNGTMPNLVRLSLRDPNTLAELNLIQDNVSNTGSYQWAIPASIADGQYRVRVKVKDAAVQDDSDVFNISAVAPLGTITILDPITNAVWHDGQAHLVRWGKTGSLPANFSISLMDSTGTTVVYTLASSAVCCEIGTNRPTPFVPGLYRVRVKSIGADVFGLSPVFTLSPDSIIVTQPTLTSSWQKTKTYTITWNKSGNLPSVVKIILYMYGVLQPRMVIAAAAPNTGSYSWTLPAWLEVGKYTIQVIAEGTGIYNTSPAFRITFIQINTPVKVKK
jgi:hypothetical protein